VVIVFIGLGWGFINNANHTPFIPVNEGEALLSLMSFLTSSSDYFGHYG
jgi:APA family basic amino acid/polyamine antiporter